MLIYRGKSTANDVLLAVNQALADIYGYAKPEALITGLTDISAQLYVEPRRRDEFHALMQANDLVTDFVSVSSLRRMKEDVQDIRHWRFSRLRRRIEDRRQNDLPSAVQASYIFAKYSCGDRGSGSTPSTAPNSRGRHAS